MPIVNGSATRSRALSAYRATRQCDVRRHTWCRARGAGTPTCRGTRLARRPARLLIEKEPVVSRIPTLVLTGQYDPITPPAWGQLAAETLGNSFYYEFPGFGHGVSFDGPCGLDIVLEFLSDPSKEPDSSCFDVLAGPDFQ